MSETTYYQRNREVILNREKDYYENNKELLRERELSKEEKNIKIEYGEKRCHNMSEEKNTKTERISKQL